LVDTGQSASLVFVLVDTGQSASLVSVLVDTGQSASLVYLFLTADSCEEEVSRLRDGETGSG